LFVFSYGSDEMKTALPGQSDVGDYQIRVFLAGYTQALFGFGGSTDCVAFESKQFSQGMQCVKIVFDDKDRPHDARVLSSNNFSQER